MRRQGGQALPLILVFMLVLCIGALITFNTGQVVNKKVELTNAADAAAYSVAVEQARAWNLAAYLNRGRVANEVAIAQIVSLNSWMTQVNVSLQMTQNYAKLLEWVPLLGEFLVALDQAANVASQFLQQFRKAFRQTAGPTIQLLDRLDTAYAVAASITLNGMAQGDMYVTATTVIKDNSPDAGLSTGGRIVLGEQLVESRSAYLDSWSVPSGRGRRSTGGERYRDVVMASRDGFVRDRRDRPSLRMLGFDINGGTDMVDYDRWSALDTNDLVVDLWFFQLNVPFGWAGTQAVTSNQRQPYFQGIQSQRRNPRTPASQRRDRARSGWYSEYSNPQYRNRNYDPYNGIRQYGRKLIPTGSMAANNPSGSWSMLPGNDNDMYLTGYHGIAHAYHDIKRNKARTPDDGPIFTVEVAADQKLARTSRQMGMGVGRMELGETAARGQIKAVASAQVYFNRPHELAMFRRVVWGGTDRSFEMGSLFSPYWQARLVETPTTKKVQLAALGGL